MFFFFFRPTQFVNNGVCTVLPQSSFAESLKDIMARMFFLSLGSFVRTSISELKSVLNHGSALESYEAIVAGLYFVILVQVC